MGKFRKLTKPKERTAKLSLKAKEKSEAPVKKSNRTAKKEAIAKTINEPNHPKPAKSPKPNLASSEKVKPSQNWLSFKTKLDALPPKPHHIRKKIERQREKQKNEFSDNVTDIVALDCEMVGGGESGRENLLARVSVVNKYNEVLYDSFVKPLGIVTDYRTQYSGVRESNLANAPDFKTVQEKVAGLIDKRILVGHDIRNDMKVLLLGHPRNKIRDTSKYKPYKQLKSGRPSLKYLAEEVLGVKIQDGEHDSIEDAKATMSLYMVRQNEWERLRKEKKAPREKIVDKTRMRKNWDRTNNSNKWFATQ